MCKERRVVNCKLHKRRKYYKKETLSNVQVSWHKKLYAMERCSIEMGLIYQGIDDH